MIAQLLLLPIGVFVVLRGNSFLALLPTLAILLLAFITEDSQLLGASGNPSCLYYLFVYLALAIWNIDEPTRLCGYWGQDLVALVTSIAFLMGYALLCIYFHAWHRLESNFDSWPWNSDTVASASGLPLCPFSRKTNAGLNLKCKIISKKRILLLDQQDIEFLPESERNLN